MDDPGSSMKPDKSSNKDCKQHVFLTKDGKPICRTLCINPPENLPQRWNIHNIVKRSSLTLYPDAFQFYLHPAAECIRDQNEWITFLTYLRQWNKVAIVKSTSCQIYLLPPEADDCSHVKVEYQQQKASNEHSVQKHCKEVVDTTEGHQLVQRNKDPENCSNSSTMSPFHNVGELGPVKDVHMKTTMSRIKDIECCVKIPESTDNHFGSDPTKSHQSCKVKQDAPSVKNYVRADPRYLEALGQAHSGWIFGAIAELVDNSRDAQATRLDISIEMVHSKRAGSIPMLSIIDDGCGMTHQEIVRLICLGHKKPDTEDVDRIGRFGVGFKTGVMRLGKDALVLTQTANSRSIAFLSQSLNEGNEDLEIPIISYRRVGLSMEFDTDVQSEASAKHNLKAVKEFSDFDKYLIGEKVGLFRGNKSGTQIYIWNLDKWGNDYSLEWTHRSSGGSSSFHQGDILIRSRRVRSRPGQMSQKVLLDYSLRSYLEVIFLVPRMRIYVQGSLVKSRPLAQSLNKTCEETGSICGKSVQLTLGRCQLEWEQGNCGIFLYWHGRLIEAYKRVGGMVHSDVGRGVIGVIDVTDLMDDDGGGRRVSVHSNKQGFLDCEPYARLEEWLGKKADEYWDNNFDTVQLKKGGVFYKPDDKWVQCDKCRKWRRLSSGFDSNSLPLEWFCYMKPFEGSCETPEQKVQRGVITVSTKRSGYANQETEDYASNTSEGSSDGNDGDVDVDVNQMKNARKGLIKRIRKGLPRACKKG